MLSSFQFGNLICICLVTILVSSGSSFAQEKNTLSPERNEASDLWTDAYAWMQTGRNLAKAKQWPLALGSYIEALQKFQTVADDFPDFEPTLVSFRLNALRDDMELMQNNLASDDHDVMMNYLDFIDSMEKGQSLRYKNNFEAALPTLQFAMTLLEEVIQSRPDEFRTAVDSQYRRLETSIEWIESQVNRKLRSRTVITSLDDGNLGTTEFIKESDMPGDPMVSISSRLFPDLLVVQNTIPLRESEAAKITKPPSNLKQKNDLIKRLPKSFGPGKIESKTEESESSE